MIRKRKPVSKLGIKFLSVVFSSAIISFLTFGLLFLSRYKIFDWFVGEETIEEATIHQIEELQNTITEQGLSKKDSEAIRKELRKYKDLTLQLYDDEATLDEISLSAKEEQAIVGTTSFWVYVYDPIFMNFTLEFSDGDAYLIVSSFIGITFIIRYVIIVLILSILLFIFLIMSFIHQKMKYILSIEEEMEYIKTGDFHHTIPYKGNDETHPDKLLAYTVNVTIPRKYMICLFTISMSIAPFEGNKDLPVNGAIHFAADFQSLPGRDLRYSSHLEKQNG